MTAQEKAVAPVHAPGVRPAATAFTGSWPYVAAWGAGLIQAALGAAGVVSPDAGALARTFGIALFMIGALTFAWGAVSLGSGRMLRPRLVPLGALVGLALEAALLVAAPARTSVLAVTASVVLLLVVAGAAATAVRHRGRPHRLPSVWGMFVAAAVASAIVTPSLGSAQDAILLRDDGTVPAVTHDVH